MMTGPVSSWEKNPKVGQSVKSLLVSVGSFFTLCLSTSVTQLLCRSLRVTLSSLRSSGYETRVKWNGTETKEPGKERRSGG